MKSKPVAAEQDWQVEDDLRTLVRAKEIERDAKRMSAVRRLAKQKMTEMNQFTQK